MKRTSLGFLMMRSLKLFILLFSATLLADVKMPAIFGDNMVLQRDIPLNIWGWASPGEKVTVEFAGQHVSATADNNGGWGLKLAPLKTNTEAQELNVAGNNRLSFKNVLVGDVWICSGQSNMAWEVSTVLNSKQEIESSENNLIRHVKIPNLINFLPQDDMPGTSWVIANPGTTASFTATGYFFAREIVKETGIPVALINTSCGGSKIEPWISPDGLKNIPELKEVYDQFEDWSPTSERGKVNFFKYTEGMKAWIATVEAAVNSGGTIRLCPSQPSPYIKFFQPTAIFNSMINPIVKFGIKGAIWYQGEANGGEDDIYIIKMKALISSWRTLWQQGDFPFYYVQLANHQKPQDKPEGGDGWSKLRDAQLKTLSVVPNTGMAVIIDIGDAGNIHPKNKQDVGKRLAAWALAKYYDKKIVFSGPLYKDMKIEGSKARISFENIGSGLVAGKKTGLEPFKETPNEKLKYFAISGTDNKWFWADAVIDGNTVLVSSDNVAEPVAVRYAFAMNPEGANLYNKDGFPASPFRTDK